MFLQLQQGRTKELKRPSVCVRKWWQHFLIHGWKREIWHSSGKTQSSQASACHTVTHQMGLMPEDGCKNAGTTNGHCWSPGFRQNHPTPVSNVAWRWRLRAGRLDPRFEAQYIKPDKVEAIKTQALAEMMDDGQGLQPQAETVKNRISRCRRRSATSCIWASFAAPPWTFF